jgi:hypothetical protein
MDCCASSHSESVSPKVSNSCSQCATLAHLFLAQSVPGDDMSASETGDTAHVENFEEDVVAGIAAGEADEFFQRESCIQVCVCALFARLPQLEALGAACYSRASNLRLKLQATTL